MPPDPTPHFDARGQLIAPRYDDLYFSADDGLAETKHVFIAGNHLPERFAAMGPGSVFTVGETGFGTGLNFLAAWQSFELHAPPDARLEFVSVEGYPLEQETMAQALQPWPELATFRDALLGQWGPLWPGIHRFSFADGRVGLTLLMGQAAEVLSAVDARVDAWFLDGFSPSRNPEMWSEAIFAEVARCSGTSATLATFTAAGFVRRGLQQAGFDVQKRPGFGTKRDMTAGRIADGQKPGSASSPKAAIVIGGSIAGAFAARAFADRGLMVTVIEKQQRDDGELPSLAPRVAVLQPKMSDLEQLPGRLLREGYARVERMLRADPSLAKRACWWPCGTFQAGQDEKTTRRLRRFLDQFEPTGLCRWIDAAQSRDELGLALPVGGVVVERAGVLRPAGLCAALLEHRSITLVDGQIAENLERTSGGWRVTCDDEAVHEADVVVLANARAAVHLHPDQSKELRAVRGQVTMLKSKEQAGQLASLRRAIFYGGYLTPAINGVQMLGATFVYDDTDTAWRVAEHLAVCDKLMKVLPEDAARLGELQNPQGWVGIRVSAQPWTRGRDASYPGLYCSLGHGSHGLASAASAAEEIASLVSDAPRWRER